MHLDENSIVSRLDESDAHGKQTRLLELIANIGEIQVDNITKSSLVNVSKSKK
jgi:hypothetical protein